MPAPATDGRDNKPPSPATPQVSEASRQSASTTCIFSCALGDPAGGSVVWLSHILILQPFAWPDQNSAIKMVGGSNLASTRTMGSPWAIMGRRWGCDLRLRVEQRSRLAALL